MLAFFLRKKKQTFISKSCYIYLITSSKHHQLIEITTWSYEV